MEPEKTFKAGAVQAAIWTNRSERGSYRTVQLTRSYKDAHGSWKHSSTLRISDLPRATLVLSKAYEYLSMAEDEA